MFDPDILYALKVYACVVGAGLGAWLLIKLLRWLLWRAVRPHFRAELSRAQISFRDRKSGRFTKV